MFLCSRNRLRSPTAEQVFSTWPGISCASAGTNHDAEVRLSAELVEWADLIFVMENAHRERLRARFQAWLRDKRVVCLDIPDDFNLMDSEPVRRLLAEVTPHLPAAPSE
jgi:predicted protein tyrosine phosphatase